VRYELVFYIPEDDILHSHRRENLKSYNHYTGIWQALLDSAVRWEGNSLRDCSRDGVVSALTTGNEDGRLAGLLRLERVGEV
jgi:hypothetical protein